MLVTKMVGKSGELYRTTSEGYDIAEICKGQAGYYCLLLDPTYNVLTQEELLHLAHTVEHLNSDGGIVE